MRGLKTFIGTAALLAGLAMAPAAQAQIVVGIGIQPVCQYGYYDQAHLTHEFRSLSGYTPSEYLALRGPYARHVPISG